MAFDINIISTGSRGNCILIDDDIVIDIGQKNKQIGTKPVGGEWSPCENGEMHPALLRGKSAVFITHRHGDHLQIPVLNDIHKDSPWILQKILYVNQDTLEHIHAKSKTLANLEIPTEHVLTSDMEFDLVGKSQTYHVKTFELVHDVENQGFVITNELGETLIYATDTDTLFHAPKTTYDYILVEGNYDSEQVMKDLLSDDPRVSYRAGQNLRHLSIQDFEDFVRTYAKPHSTVYQLHESDGYGNMSELVYRVGEHL